MRIDKLKNVITLTMGQSPSSESYNEVGEGLPFFQGKADFGKIIPTVRIYCSQPSKLAVKNDILMSVRAPVGDINISDVECCIGRGLASLRTNEKELYYKYLYYVLSFKKEQIANMGTGSTFKAINKGVLEEFEIPIPTLEVQNQIAGALDKAQELIDKRKEQMQACDELIKSQFIEMFGELKDEVELSQYIDSLTAGKSLAGEAECKNKVLKTGSVSYDYFDANEVKNLPLDYEPLESHLVKQGNVIISRMNTVELVGATGYVWTTPDNTYLPDRLWRAEIKNNVNPIFLWQLLIQDSTKGKIRRIASGTSGSMKNISKQGLLGIKVINVDIEKQNQFAQFVQQVDKLKFEMQQSLVELENNFNALMQKAFKGELF